MAPSCWRLVTSSARLSLLGTFLQMNRLSPGRFCPLLEVSEQGSRPGSSPGLCVRRPGFRGAPEDRGGGRRAC